MFDLSAAAPAAGSPSVILETVITFKVCTSSFLSPPGEEETKWRAVWEETSLILCLKSKHDPVAHIARVTHQRKEASRTMSFIDTSRNDNTFYLFSSDETCHLISVLLWVSPADRELIANIESWYLMPWDVYCPPDAADIMILRMMCITFEMEFVIVSQNIPGIRFAAVSCCCHKELSNVGPGTDPGLEFVRRWCEIETWLSSDNLLYQASH